MLTVSQLLEEVDLELTAGSASDAPIRWVHISELPDPTPWLSGGELLLTTGIKLRTAAEQREFVRRLSNHGLTGLGFGTGFGHDKLPRALAEEARKLDFPLFEVPYEMPFIALTERAFGHLVNEQYDMLRRGTTIQRRLEQLVIDERGIEEVARALASAIAGAVIVLDSRGRSMASAEFRRTVAPDVMEQIAAEIKERHGQDKPVLFAPAAEKLEGRSIALPVASVGGTGAEAWLIAVRDAGGLGDFERLVLQQAVTVVALELMRRRVVRDTERRLAGDVLSEAVSGALDETELRARLGVFGINDDATVFLFRAPDPARAEATLEQALAELGISALVATHDELLAAIADVGDADPMQTAADLRERLSGTNGTVRAAISRTAPLENTRRSYHEARFAMEASVFANGHGPSVASYKDLGAYQLLLAVQDDDALRLYCESVLGPIDEAEGEYGDELIRSLEAFLEHNGQWEKASRALYCHRHTLRYRIRRIEQLTGRDLSSAKDRIEFWLALQARELIA